MVINGQELSTIDQAQVLEKVVLEGDLSKLNPEERLAYYRAVCESVGLNPLTKPFDYIKLQGRLTLYPNKECAAQLRRQHKISLVIDEHRASSDNNVYFVRVTASTFDGRLDTGFGAVPVKGLSIEGYANAMMKAETKAKRRATLSICGLGWAADVDYEAEAQVDTPAQIYPPAQSIDRDGFTAWVKENDIEPSIVARAVGGKSAATWLSENESRTWYDVAVMTMDYIASERDELPF